MPPEVGFKFFKFRRRRGRPAPPPARRAPPPPPPPAEDDQGEEGDDVEGADENFPIPATHDAPAATVPSISPLFVLLGLFWLAKRRR